LHMHDCCFVVSFRLSFEQPLCSSMNGESIWRSQGFTNSITWPYVAPRVFITYFLKNNTSLRQNNLKNLRAWVRSLISGSIWCLFGSYLASNLVGRKRHKESWSKWCFQGVRRCDRRWVLASNASVTCKWRSLPRGTDRHCNSVIGRVCRKTVIASIDCGGVFLLRATDADQRQTLVQWTRLSGLLRKNAFCGASVITVLRPTPTVIASVAWIRNGLDPKSARYVGPPPHLSLSSHGLCSSWVLSTPSPDLAVIPSRPPPLPSSSSRHPFLARLHRHHHWPHLATAAPCLTIVRRPHHWSSMPPPQNLGTARTCRYPAHHLAWPRRPLQLVWFSPFCDPKSSPRVSPSSF
jgi:hypothetical protein